MIGGGRMRQENVRERMRVKCEEEKREGKEQGIKGDGMGGRRMRQEEVKERMRITNAEEGQEK